MSPSMAIDEGHRMQTELVARAQRGDREAFSVLAAAASARLYTTSYLIVGRADRAEDAVQDALVAAWRDIRGLRDPDRLDAWLYRLVVRACYRQLRRDRRRRVLEIDVSDVVGGVVVDSARAVADRDEMERAFRRLTADQRAILTLVYYADLSLADASTALAIPLGTTKSRLNRAIAALRAALAADARAIEAMEGQPA
jgi:RNA polymerase sigma-70 factor (ECF subfamily)